MTTVHHSAVDDAVLARLITEELTDPDEIRARHRPPVWWRQSLASGALAIALLHVHRARTGDGPWDRVHRWLCLVAGGPIDDGPGSNLHYGAPALGYVLHHASGGTGRYRRALGTLDERVAAITGQRLDAAHRRIDAGCLPAPAEFDVVRGLTGLGAYCLHRTRNSGEHSPLLRQVLAYLVRLTEPLPHPALDVTVPGWWSLLGPAGRPADAFPGGHANHGMAHGIAGPLALLALTARAGITVGGQHDAIDRIQAWLDRWRVTDGDRAWWPYWITTADLTEPASSTRQPGRPSWCYGAPGLARAQQLAALALDRPGRLRDAETALGGVLTNPAQVASLTDGTLCHGHAGLVHVGRCAAADSPRIDLRRHVTDLCARADPALGSSKLRPWGLLEGLAGVALARTPASPHVTGWDTCLLTS